MKIFISYARVDKPLCKQVVNRLQNAHEVWYDRRLHAGQAWWEEIQRRLAWCEGFVYLLSPESVASAYCQREYEIAAEAGKHIFPVLIQARTDIPDSLSHIHYADLSEGMEDVVTLMDALTVAERLLRVAPPPPATHAPAPPPRKTASPNQAIARAADAMDAEDFDNAVFIIKQALEQRPKGRAARLLQTLLADAEQALARQTYLREAAREYAPIRELVNRAATRALGCEEWQAFRQDFPDYDPDNVAAKCASLPPAPARSRSLDLMPAPFAWIEIPGGQGTLETDHAGVTLSIPTERYWIAKYPVTNAQFAKFIEAGGYANRAWWTDAGWAQREEDGWTEPRYWRDDKWNQADHPVVGVSWYEAVAFCLWLNHAVDPPVVPPPAGGKREVRGDERGVIMLPTEAQWQYAAQGDDGRAYPWGDKPPNESLCNFGRNVGRTTPVTQYEGKGDSPFGVVDMAGNVWEWCLTDYENQTNDLHSKANMRVLRGGSWWDNGPDDLRSACRYGYPPLNWDVIRGFRVSRS